MQTGPSNAIASNSLRLCRSSTKSWLGLQPLPAVNTCERTEKMGRRNINTLIQQPNNADNIVGVAVPLLATNTVQSIKAPMRCLGALTMPTVPSTSAPKNAPSVTCRCFLRGCWTSPTTFISFLSPVKHFIISKGYLVTKLIPCYNLHPYMIINGQPLIKWRTGKGFPISHTFVLKHTTSQETKHIVMRLLRKLHRPTISPIAKAVQSHYTWTMVSWRVETTKMS